jgi:hypothetical protein
MEAAMQKNNANKASLVETPNPAPARPKTPVAKAKPAAPKTRSAVSKSTTASAKAVPAATSAGNAVKAAAKPKNTVQPQAKAKPIAQPKEKIRKPKLVRDSFTMPETEYQVLGDVKKACLKAGIEVKKSQLLRVGVALIKTMDVGKLGQAIAALPPLKAGRPKKAK